MDGQKTNGSDEVLWSDRKKHTHAFQNDNNGGVALEYMIELCNLLEADPWFCMPHKAAGTGEDDYVTKFAQMVRDGDIANGVTALHSEATIYIEWSNERWNIEFSQYSWLDPVPRSDAWFNKWADEAGNDFIIWGNIFDTDSRTLVRVVSGHKEVDWIIENVLGSVSKPILPPVSGSVG